ncbi:MAG TPA: histidine kinase [Marinobacter sp.]|uniref:sensor histidine kinase n=1 Tax=Marinobacter sp. TaxID=50741 RepID=UPI000EE275F7|nr:sensor histidine kinase [Marinobacter sp.]MBC7190824.1 sensor histidine kinase [Marinobacter sp.]HCW89578.1 histidine kinase [Marinobacter sp.]
MTPLRKPASVRSTLLILLLPSATALMALAWLVHGLLLERMSSDFVEIRLKDEVAFLAHQIRKSGGRIDSLNTGDYFQEVFHHAFAIHSGSRTRISPKSWQPLLRPLIGAGQDGVLRAGSKSIPGVPAEVMAYRESFMVGGELITVIVAEDLAALKSSQGELHVWTAIVSLLLILLLVAVLWFGINLSLKPVVALKDTLRRLQDGEISRIEVQAPEELQPLATQLNQLLDSLDQRLERSREALANLSHSVKTPIAAVRQILADTHRPLDRNLRHQMVEKLSDIDRKLEAEMRRSQFAGPQIGKNSYPVKQARDLVWMFGRLYPEKSFELSTTLSEDERWPVEEHDLNEILGNLLDNAGKWSDQRVELQIGHHNGQACITLLNDGVGVQEKELPSLGLRGMRLDEQTPGHGLGLAIVREILARYRGCIRFANRSPRGFLAEVRIPDPRHGGR